MRRLLVIAALAACWGCGAEDEVPTSGRNRDTPYRVTENFVATETSGGRTMWRLEAREARTYQEPARTLLDTVTVFFYEDDGSLRSTLRSDFGRAQEEQGLLIAQDNVRVISVEGDTLDTDFLRYNREEDRVSGPGPVRLAQADRVLTGTGFRAAPDLSDYEIFEDVKIVSRKARGRSR